MDGFSWENLYRKPSIFPLFIWGFPVSINIIQGFPIEIIKTLIIPYIPNISYNHPIYKDKMTTCAKEDEGMIRQIHPLRRLGNLAQRCGRIQLLRFQRSEAKMEGRHGGGMSRLR